MRLISYCRNISMETVFMNTENCKTSELHKFVLNLPQKLETRSLSKYFVPQNLFITCGKI